MSRSLTDALAWALIHFIWQGALIALLTGMASFVLRKSRSTVRYGLFCVALVALLVVPAMTLISLSHDVVAATATATEISPDGFVGPVATAEVAAVSAPAVTRSAGPAWLPWLVRLWFVGVVLLSLRSAGGWVLAQRLKYWKTTPAAEAIQRLANRIRGRLDIGRMVRVVESSVAEVPAVIGWIRPVILLPVSAVTALSPEQIELLLAHELAHIRRYDYLVNLLQTAVETVLFYHPAVWWISSQIRAEREHCCDDLAVQACGDALAYARTLEQLEGLRTRQPMELAVAADGGSLLGRIQRLLQREGKRRYAPPAWIGALLPVAVVLIAVFSVRPTEVKAVVPEGTPEAVETSAEPMPAGTEQPRGYLAGLSSVGYTKISVEEIIALKQNGVEPRYIAGMLTAGLGTPTPEQLIKMKQHGVEPEFATAIVKSGIVRDLSFENLIPLREHGIDANEMARVRALGFGPYRVEELTKMRDHGIGHKEFEALKEAGVKEPGVQDAVMIQENGISAESVRSARTQGFASLTLEQIVKLKRAGVI